MNISHSDGEQFPLMWTWIVMFRSIVEIKDRILYNRGDNWRVLCLAAWPPPKRYAWLSIALLILIKNNPYYKEEFNPSLVPAGHTSTRVPISPKISSYACRRAIHCDDYVCHAANIEPFLAGVANLTYHTWPGRGVVAFLSRRKGIALPVSHRIFRTLRACRTTRYDFGR